MSKAKEIDVGELLDTGPWTSFQIRAVLLVALAVILDGFDGQLIGYAIPVMMKDWGVARGAFSPVVAAGLIGMGLGSFFGGVVGDRIGRRRAILFSVLAFAVATCAISLAHDIPSLTLLRFLAGLGIGGCLPNATTTVAEYTPARLRTIIVTSTIVCVPLGGMVAGLFAGPILQQYDWQTLFLAGGALPLCLSLLLAVALPESPRFLVRRPERWGQLSKLLVRLSRPTPEDAVFVDVREQQHEGKGGLKDLFGARAYDTVLISSAFFLCLLAVYTAFSWLPTMLSAEGLEPSVAGQGLTYYNFGGVLGAVGCSIVVARFGSRWPLIVCALGGAASALTLQLVPVSDTLVFMTGLTIHGLFVNAVQSTLYAVCAYIYPTRVRASGTAFGISIGRLGAILSAFVGAAVITAGGATAYLLLLGMAMIGVTVALFLLRGHILPKGRLT